MRLALVRGRYSHHGGAEKFLDNLLVQLAKRGMDTTLFTREWKNDQASPFAQILQLHSFHIGRWWRDAAFARAVQRALAREHFDLVQSHERIPGCHVFRAGDGLHKTWLTLREKAGGWRARFSSCHPYHRFILRNEHRMLTDPHLLAVICNSRMVAQDVQASYGVQQKKIHIIANGVDGHAFHPNLADQYRLPWRTNLGIPESDMVLLHVGSGFARKGVARTLHAMAALSRRNVWLVVVGQDRHMSRYQRLATKLGLDHRVRFSGAVHDPRPYYGMADVFVLPTLYDPCPNAVLEALSCGLPVITSHTCGAGEYILPSISGWLVDALDVKSLTNYLEVATMPEVATQMRTAARNAVSAITPQQTITDFLSLYDRLRSA